MQETADHERGETAQYAIVPIGLLVLLLPLEPFPPVARVAGFQLSVVELAALTLIGLAAGILAFRAGRTLRRPPTPLLGSALVFLGVCLASTYFAEPPRWLPFKFTLRITAGITSFAVTSWALAYSKRASFLPGCFAISAIVTACVGLLETISISSVETFVAPFREQNFEVGGRSRIASTFAYPNIAAGFWVLALPAILYLLAEPTSSGRGKRFLTGGALIVFAAIVMTFSRGALLGALGGSAAMWGLLYRRRDPARFRLGRLQLGFLALMALAAVSEPTFRLRTSTESDQSWYRASVEPEGLVRHLAPGELTTFPVTVTNTGTMTWKPDDSQPFQVSYVWFFVDGAGSFRPLPSVGERTLLEKDVRPGERVELDAKLRAPDEPGQYLAVWDMVQTHPTWFADKVGLGTPALIRVGEMEFPQVPDSGELLTLIKELSWRPSRSELWRLAIALFRERPLLGVGPDNFRWRYGREAGRSNWDTRTFSNSLFLETLANTGILGAVSWFGLLSCAGYRLLSRARSGTRFVLASSVLSSLAGFLIHGVFDYLLEFTSIYFAFWILLGVASSLDREA